MGLIEFIAKKLELAKKRRQLRAIEQFIGQLEDQVASGEAALVHWQRKRDQLQAQIHLDTPPDEIVRRSFQL